uniref:Mediator of RNA polymerase II transcription subunit 21 n=1 Tax=Panagrellus redivivus TaxID=6233 RepID=A0A7E4W0M3_PANRE
MDSEINNNDQASTVNGSSTGASPQGVSKVSPNPSNIDQTLAKIVEDLTDVVNILTADPETPSKRMEKMMSVAANIQHIGGMLTKELEVTEECIMSAEAKASADESYIVTSFEEIIKMFENPAQDKDSRL